MVEAPFLSIVISAYNEANRIGATLLGIYDYMASKNYEYEIILIDDGSTDMTCDVAGKSILAQNGHLRIICNEKNMGKGYSVTRGMKNSAGEYVLFTDADLSTPISEIEKLFKAIKNGCDIAIGSRAVKSSLVVVPQVWYRTMMGRIFNFLVRFLALKGIHDTQCGFKLFKGVFARELAGSMIIDGFCFGVEMLCLARNKGYRISEVGILLENFPERKVRIMNSSVQMFFNLLGLSKGHL